MSILYVMIATAGTKTLLEDTLTSLSKCNFPDSYQGTIVIENGRKYEAEKIVDKFKNTFNVRYIYSTHANKSHALNVALKEIPDEALIFFTDDDVWFSPDLLSSYSKKAMEYSNGFFFGGPTFARYETPPPDWIKSNLPPSCKGYVFDEKNFSSSMFLGFNWAAFSKDIKNLGGFNPDFGPGTFPKKTGQETEMQNRLLMNGFKPVYIPDAKVWHFVPSKHITLKWLLKRKFQGGVGKGMRIKKKNNKYIYLLIKEVIKNAIDLLWTIFENKEKKITKLSNLFTSVGKLKGYYLK